MAAFRGFYAAVPGRAASSEPLNGAEGLADSCDAAPGPRRVGQWSCGRAHAALVSNGIARKQIRHAAEMQKLVNNGNQDIARITFSHLSRGRNSSSLRAVYRSCILLFRRL